MPIELSPETVRYALAKLGEHDLDAARDVEGALEWIAPREDPEAPVAISRYRLQIFLWYQLPCKWLTSVERKRAVAARLGRFLESMGGRAAAYAKLCTSEDTMRLLKAWEDEDGAGELLRDSLEASGIEPPDTDAIKWGSVMGLEEARLRNVVALELERAVEAGRLVPEERGFKRRQAEFVSALLCRPSAELGARTPLEIIAEERLESWARRGSEERRAIVAEVEPLLRGPESPGGAAAMDREALEPLTWLLDVAAEGLALTQTGALSRALVRAAVERFPEWWSNADLFGPPYREGEVIALCEVHELVRRMRLLRRSGRKLVLTRRGETLRHDPEALLHAGAPHLLAGDGFEGTVQELAAAVLLSHETIDRHEMEAAVHAAIVADGWNTDGEPPWVEDVAGAAAGLIRVTDALGLVRYDHEYDHETGFTRRDLTLMRAGREALRLALRSRALAPAKPM